MKTILLLLILLPVTASAQSLTLSPLSMKGWGTTPDMSQVTIGYEAIEIHYFHNWSTHIYQGEGITQSSFAISYSPIREKYFEAGAMMSSRRLPVDTATTANFILKGVLPIGSVDIMYTHISNGFGLFHDVNPGMDFISIRISL